MLPPVVSVVAAVFNGERDVEAACRSVLAQSYRNLELLVIDDASTDDTPRILAKLSAEDARLRSVRNIVQCGQTRSLNRGIQLSLGSLIARIDSDDSFRPTKLERQVAFLERNADIAVVGTWAMRVDESGREVGPFRPPVSRTEIDFGLVHSSPLCHVSVLIRKSALSAVGCYDADYRYAADLKLWSDIRRAGFGLANIPQILVDYRVADSTFGGSVRTGLAADEAAVIIQRNAKSMCGLELGERLCRAIHLRSERDSDLSAEDRRAAFVALCELARRHFGHVPLRMRLRFLAGATWSFAIGAGRNGRNDTSSRRKGHFEVAALRFAGLGTAERLGRIASSIGPRGLSNIGGIIRRGIGK